MVSLCPIAMRAKHLIESGIYELERILLGGSRSQPVGLETDNPDRLKSNAWRTDKQVSARKFHDLKIGILRCGGIISHRLVLCKKGGDTRCKKCRLHADAHRRAVGQGWINLKQMPFDKVNRCQREPRQEATRSDQASTGKRSGAAPKESLSQSRQWSRALPSKPDAAAIHPPARRPNSLAKVKLQLPPSTRLPVPCDPSNGAVTR
jgi:hypothetical protein